jgi:hypothetical protein
MWRAAWLAGTCLWLAACAAPDAPAPLPPFRDPALTLKAGAASIVPGRTTREQLATVLGPASVVRFDSGFEVWVYRSRTAANQRAATGGGAELVVLVDPSGVVKKSRVRPADAR